MEKLTESQKTKAARLAAIQTQISELKVEEADLRRELFARVFTNPVEGSGNKASLPNGFILQGTRKITRTVDQEEATKLRNGDNTKSLAESIFLWKASLDTKAYKTLSSEDRVLVADAVTEKDGMPSLEIKKPKR